MPSVRPNIAEMKGYTPGEQPQGVEKFIKLNTNENPYQCSPKVKAAIGRVVQAGLQKYPDPMASARVMGSEENPSNFPAAAAAPNTPRVDVACQPTS